MICTRRAVQYTCHQSFFLRNMTAAKLSKVQRNNNPSLSHHNNSVYFCRERFVQLLPLRSYYIVIHSEDRFQHPLASAQYEPCPPLVLEYGIANTSATTSCHYHFTKHRLSSFMFSETQHWLTCRGQTCMDISTGRTGRQSTPRY